MERVSRRGFFALFPAAVATVRKKEAESKYTQKDMDDLVKELQPGTMLSVKPFHRLIEAVKQGLPKK